MSLFPNRGAARPNHHLFRLAALLAGGALAVAIVGPALADGPTPAPVVFGTPQLLV